jgi:hypothetical protein
MKAAEDGCRYDVAHVLDGATDRSVFVERPMSPQLIIIGGILHFVRIRRKCASPKDNQMIDALASDRSDQPFGEAVVCSETQNSHVVVMQSAEERMRRGATDPLNRQP